MNKKRRRKKPKVNIYVRALDVLEYICFKNSSEITIDEVSKIFTVSKSTGYRILDALTKKGYLDHMKKGANYSLGFKFVELGWKAISKQSIIKISSPLIEKLVLTTGESSILGILKDHEVFYLQKIGGKGILRVDVEVETHAPLHCTSLGKVLLAWFPKDERNKIVDHIEFKKYTVNTITNPVDFKKILDITKKRGYATASEEYILGTCSLGYPIFNKHNEVVSAISLVVPSIRFTKENRKFFAKHISDTASKLARKFSYFET